MTGVWVSGAPADALKGSAQRRDGRRHVARSLVDRVFRSRVARQFGALTAARMAAAALSFVWLAVATRFLSVTEFADLALLLTVGAIMSVLADGGLPIILNEALAAEPSRGRATLVLVLRRRMPLTIVGAAAMAALFLLAASEARPLIPVLFAGSMLASSWYTSCSAALRGAVSVVPEAVNETLSRLFVLVLGTILVARGAGLLGAVATYVAADVLSAFGLTVVAWRRLSPNEPADPSDFRMSRVLPLGAAAVAGVLYYRIDVWLLAIVSQAGEVARYTVSYRIIDVLILPAGALAVVTIGSLARLDDRAAVRRADRMAGILCLGVLPAVVVLLVVPGPLLEFAFGANYRSGATVLRILALAVLPSVAALVWGPLVALRHRGLLGVTLLSLTVNVALNLALIPHIGARGAAVVTFVGQLAYAALLRLLLVGLVRRDAALPTGAVSGLPNKMHAARS